MSPGKKGRETAVVGQVSPLATYVVDYDLPADFRRKRFYRAIARYLSLHQLEETSWSTGSVVWTDNEDFAWTVYRQARAVGGTAHVYEARRLDDEP
jgi:hypothetical protein